MKNRTGIIVARCVLAGAICLLLFGTRHANTLPLPGPTEETDAPVSSPVPIIAQAAAASSPADNRTVSAPLPANFSTATTKANHSLPNLSTEPEFTRLPPETVMENLRTAFRNYLSAFRENAVGDNREITQALDGGNRKQTHFLNEDEGLRVNARGELMDPWGTPFFFHQLSGTEMELHSAGPDRVLWTPDDLVSK